MNKKHKIILIVFNIISLIGFLISAWIAYDIFRLKFVGDLSALGLIALLPLFFIVTAILLVFSIVLLVCLKKAKRKAEENQTKLKLYEVLFSFTPLIFTIINIIITILFFVL